MSDVRRFMPQLVTGLPGQRTSPGVAMVEVTDGGFGWVDLSVHERALAAEARWSALEAVARAERDIARDQLAAKDAEIAELRELAAERSECADQAGDVAAEAIAAQRKAESERDEARECVRRLCEILREIYVNTPISEELYEKALAATPEHLR